MAVDTPGDLKHMCSTMKNPVNCIAIFVFCGFPLFMMSQEVDSIRQLDLPEVQIKESPMRAPTTSLQVKTLPTRATSSTQLLEYRTPFFFRNRGNQTLSTVSIRGSSAQQTEILWNGASMNSPMLGLQDISGLNLLMFDQVDLDAQQVNNAYQSIGGAIGFSNEPDEKNRLELGIQAGQFEHFSSQLRSAVHFTDELSAQITLVHENDFQRFPYLEEHSSVLLPDQQPNAHIQRLSGMLQLYYRPKEHQVFALRIWAGALNREIPPKITQRRSRATQQDSFARYQFEYSEIFDHWKYSTTLTHRKEGNHYRDDLNQDFGTHSYRSTQWTQEARLPLTSGLIARIGSNLAFNHLRSTHYITPRQISNFQLFITPKWGTGFHNFFVEGDLRRIGQKKELPQWAGSLAVGQEWNENAWKIEGRNTTRYPTGNDLYWYPYGNSELDPEEGVELNLGYYRRGKRSETFTLTSEIYYKRVKNWILWAPDNSLFYRPQNLLEVTAMGGEIQASLPLLKKEGVSFIFDGNYNYQIVTNSGNDDTPIAQSGSNLIYTPRHQASGSLEINFWGWQLMYSHRWRSSIYVDNQGDGLPEVRLGMAQLQYQTKIIQHDIQCYLNVQNVWNQAYEFQPQVPAPGRQFRLGIILSPNI